MFANTKAGAKQDARNATRNLSSDAQDSLNEVSADITDIANRAGRKVRSYYNAAAHELGDDYDIVTSRIKSNPVQASLVALGAGVILGALLRRL